MSRSIEAAHRSAQHGRWTFVTNHGRVLSLITKQPRITTREIAARIGITERAVQKIVAALEADGYIMRQKEGRGSLYEIHPDLPMRHPLERDHPVSDLLIAVGCKLICGDKCPRSRQADPQQDGSRS